MRVRDSIYLVAWTLSALLLATPAAAPQGFTPRDVAKLRSAATAVMSPDGERVAYLLTVPREPLEDEDGAAWTELHVVDHGGSDHAFVGGHVNVSQIAWTPDGRGITFLAKRDGDDYRALYVIPVAGGESRRLVAHGANISSYALAPDAKRVAFLANEPESDAEKKLDEQGFDQIIYEEDWRAVRVWIAEPDTERDRGEGHGNRRAGSRFDYNLRMLRWMEHYLLGPGGDRPDYDIAYEQAMTTDALTSETNEP